MANKLPETDNVPEKKEVSLKAQRKAERLALRKEKNKDKAVVDVRNKQMKRFSALSIVLAILIVIILNVFLEMAVGDKLSFDFTSNQLMSVGEVSEELLDNLDQDVRMVVLSDKETYEANHRFMPALLDEYVAKSNGHVSLEYVNPVNVPTIYTELDPENFSNLSAGQLVIKNEANDRMKVLKDADYYSTQINQQTFQQQVTGYKAESSISGAINYVTLDSIPTVFFTNGHGEVELDSEFTYFNSLLTNNGFDVDTINLATAGEVPEEASILVMLAPDNDLTAPEAEVVLDFLRRGGGFMFAAGPFSVKSMPNLNYVLSEYNVTLNNDRVRETDTDRYFYDNPNTMAVTAPANGITPQKLDRSVLIMDSYHVEALTNTVDWIEVKSLLETSDLGARESEGIAENLSTEAVQTVGLMIENRGFMDGKAITKPARMVVLGSASLFADQTFGQIGFTSWYNYSLTYSMMNWLSNNEANTSTLLIRDKELVNYNLSAVTSQTPLNVSAVIATIIIPVALLIGAIVVYRRRKHL